MRIKPILHTAAALFAVATPSVAQPASVRPARLAQPPVIDGSLNDEAWTMAAVLDDFRQVQPGDNLPPSWRTEVRIGYDRRALYLAFRAEDASGAIRASVSRRDAIAADDMIGVYLDTFHDRRRAYYLFFNPLGVQADGIHTEGLPEPDLSLDLVVESHGIVDAGGYTVEVAIPFASLRYTLGDTPTWGLHVMRFIRRDRNEQISWMALSRDRSSLLDQQGVLGPFAEIGEGRALEITPTAVTTSTATAAAPAHAEAEAGLTLNLGLTPTMNVAATANPDFAQVEADQLVLTVNQRFPLFYEEKRPFFLEGLDTFQTPLTLFHTRTVVAPEGAAKLTGKHGRTTVGVLAAADGGAKSVVRLRRDVGRDSTVGAAVTGWWDGPRSSQVASLDARLRLDERTVLTSQIAGSWAETSFRDPPQVEPRDRFGVGLGYYAKLERRGRHLAAALTATGFAPDFRADLGFLRRVNTNAVSAQATFLSEPQTERTLISWTATNVVLAQWDWQGRADFVYVYPQVRLNFRRQTYVAASAFRDYERLFEEEFGPRRGPGRTGAFAGHSERSTSWEGYGLQVGTAPGEVLALSASVSSSWDVFDYDFGAGPKFPRVSPAALADPAAPQDPGPATSHGFGADASWRPVDALRASVNVSRSRLVRNDTRRIAYDATLISLRTTYQFTRFASVRLRTDWDSAHATLRGQYLFDWTPHPGTAIYAGFNDEVTIDGFDVATGARTPRFERRGRTLFVKVSYLLRRML